MPSKSIIAMLCITAILTAALIKGIDGLLLASGLALISGLGGFVIGHRFPPK